MSAPNAPNLARRTAVIAAGWVCVVWSMWAVGILGPVVHPVPHHHHHGGITLAALCDGTNTVDDC